MEEPILGVVLAGGLSTRMGREKAFVALAGSPLLRHVLDRFAPQVDAVAINANGEAGRFAEFGLDVVPDSHANTPGPLAGLAAALALASRRGFRLVATAPSDAPFLPRDAVARLKDSLDADALAAVATGPNGLEPLVGVWRAGAAEPIERALAEGRRAVHRLLADVPHRLVHFTASADAMDPFANLNTPSDLAEAERVLRKTSGLPGRGSLA